MSEKVPRWGRKAAAHSETLPLNIEPTALQQQALASMDVTGLVMTSLAVMLSAAEKSSGWASMCLTTSVCDSRRMFCGSDSS